MKIKPIRQKAPDHVLRSYVVIKLSYHREELNFWDVAERCYDGVGLCWGGAELLWGGRGL